MQGVFVSLRTIANLDILREIASEVGDRFCASTDISSTPSGSFRVQYAIEVRGPRTSAVIRPDAIDFDLPVDIGEMERSCSFTLELAFEELARSIESLTVARLEVKP